MTSVEHWPDGQLRNAPNYPYTINAPPPKRSRSLLAVGMIWVMSGPCLAVTAVVAMICPALTATMLTVLYVSQLVAVTVLVIVTTPHPVFCTAPLAAGERRAAGPTEPSRPIDGETSFAPPSPSSLSLRALPGAGQAPLGNPQTMVAPQVRRGASQ